MNAIAMLEMMTDEQMQSLYDTMVAKAAAARDELRADLKATERHAADMEELYAVAKAERDALLAAYIGHLPCGPLRPDGEWRWTANVPTCRALPKGAIVADTQWETFDTREAAESAILAAARAAHEAKQAAAGVAEEGGNP